MRSSSSNSNYLPASGPGGGFRSNKAAFLQMASGRRLASSSPAPWQVKEASPGELPSFIRPGDRVAYTSRSTGKTLEVVIENVSRPKREILITFADDRKVWKCIPFNMVLSRACPLMPLSHGRGEKSEVQHRALPEMLNREVPQSLEAPDTTCAYPLPLVGGMLTKVIADDAIVASSYFMNNPRHGLGQMWRSRINCTDGAWRAAADTAAQCIRWDLGEVKQVMRVQTKGCFTEPHWVTEFELSHSEDGKSWTRCGPLLGNNDQDTLMEHELDPPLRARMVRLHPTKWHGHVSLRAELLGLATPVALPGPQLEEPKDACCAVAAASSRSRSPRR